MVKINQNIILKALALLLCFYIAIAPFFQPRKAYANFTTKYVNFIKVVSATVMGLRSVGYIGETTLTPENLDAIYTKADEYLHKNFGTELEYVEALRQVDQLGLDIASGAAFFPGKYSGKLWYAFVDAVSDVLYPQDYSNIEYPNAETFVASFGNLYVTQKINSGFEKFGIPTSGWVVAPFDKVMYANFSAPFEGNWGTAGCLYTRELYYSTPYTTCYVDCITKVPSKNYSIFISRTKPYDKYIGAALGIPEFIALLNTNAAYVPSVKKATADKATIPTRLPQSIINNINNYIDNSSENIIINPTDDDLKDIPTVEVTPDQPGTTDPTPTPDPTPEPTPTPTAPEYNGDKWVNPIGEFIAGLLEFLKSAFIPTMSIDTTPLTNANFDMTNKFPFSLPGTFKTLLTTVNAPGKTPVFDMTFDMTKLGFQAPIVWHIDLHEWDTGAGVAKTALYIIFLLGLLFMTKKLFVK